MATLARFGSDVFLIRRLEAPSKELYHEVFTFLLGMSVIVGAGGAALASFVIPRVTSPAFVSPTQVLLLALPMVVLSVPAIAALERALQSAIAFIEVGGYAVFNVPRSCWRSRILGTGLRSPPIGSGNR